MLSTLKMQYNCLLSKYIQLISICPHSQMQDKSFKRLKLQEQAVRHLKKYAKD